MLSLQKWHPGETATTRARLLPAGTTAFSWSYCSPFSTCGIPPGACAVLGKNWLRTSTTAAIAQTRMMAMFATVSSVLFFAGTGLLMAIDSLLSPEPFTPAGAASCLKRRVAQPQISAAPIDRARGILQRTPRLPCPNGRLASMREVPESPKTDHGRRAGPSLPLPPLSQPPPRAAGREGNASRRPRSARLRPPDPQGLLPRGRGGRGGAHPAGPAAGAGGEPRQRADRPGPALWAAAGDAAVPGQEHPVEEPVRPPLPRRGAGDPRLPPAGRGVRPHQERRHLRPLPRAAGQGGLARPLPRGDEPQRALAQAAEDRRRAHHPGGRAEVPRHRRPDRPRRPALRLQADLPFPRPAAGGGAGRPGAGDRPRRPGPGGRRPRPDRPHRRRPERGHPQLRDLGRRPADRPRRGPLPPPRRRAADAGEPRRGVRLPPRLPGGVWGDAAEPPREGRRRGAVRQGVRRAPPRLRPPGRPGGSGLPPLAGPEIHRPHPAAPPRAPPPGGGGDRP